jgi:hypothetical protein
VDRGAKVGRIHWPCFDQCQMVPRETPVRRAISE